MFPDGLVHRSPQDRVRYAEILVYIAAADGALVREEIAMIEAMVGRAMIHPESRLTIRAGFEQPIPLSNHSPTSIPALAKITLRDAALVAAVDGDYDRRELSAPPKDCEGWRRRSKTTLGPPGLGHCRVGMVRKLARFYRETVLFHPLDERHLQREKAFPSVWWGHCKTGSADGTHDWTGASTTVNCKSTYGSPHGKNLSGPSNPLRPCCPKTGQRYLPTS